MNSNATTASFFFFNDTATTEIYTLSLHDALPILELLPAAFRGEYVEHRRESFRRTDCINYERRKLTFQCPEKSNRSEEHTSELQSRPHLVCRLLLEKKNPTF